MCFQRLFQHATALKRKLSKNNARHVETGTPWPVSGKAEGCVSGFVRVG